MSIPKLPEISRRDFMGVAPAAVLAQTPAPAGAAPDAGAIKNVNVRDFGAKGDGRTDDTAAFNRATQAAAKWSEGIGCAIYVPSGQYRIDGTVFVRKGQMLHGDGETTLIDASKARGRTFVLGRGATDRPDPGGAPVGLSGLRTLGGSGTNALIYCDSQGFALRDLFLGAAGIAVQLVNAADGLISGVTIDQGLNGLVLEGSQNIVINGLAVFRPHYALTLAKDCRDIVITGATFCYARYASIYFAHGASNIRAIQISACNFVSNEQADTFEADVYLRASKIDAQFTGCSFRNWRRHAVFQAAGVGANLHFSSCVFDGAPSADIYNGSLDAQVLATGEQGSFFFEGCQFRNLRGPIATLSPGLTQLHFHGGAIANCHPTRFIAPPGLSAQISIRSVAGFGVEGRAGNEAQLKLPAWPNGPAWRVTAREDVNGAAPYAEEAVHMIVGPDNRTGPTRAVSQILWALPDAGGARTGATAEKKRTDPAFATGESGLDELTVRLRVRAPSARVSWSAETA